jgi:hypothetical protein
VGHNFGSGILVDSSHVVIEGNYVGTDYTGAKAVANHNGIQINGATNVNYIIHTICHSAWCNI